MKTNNGGEDVNVTFWHSTSKMILLNNFEFCLHKKEKCDRIQNIIRVILRMKRVVKSFVGKKLLKLFVMW